MLVAKQLQLFNNICWGGVCKSWRTVPRRCSSAAKAPWLELSEANDNILMKLIQKKPRPHAFTIPEYPGFQFDIMKYGTRWVWPEHWTRYAGCSHGFLFTVTDDEHYPMILYKPHRCTPSVPPWDKNVPFCLATLCLPYTHSYHSVMVITGISNPAFAICTEEESQTWSQHDCTITDPHHSEGPMKPMAFTNAIGFKGKFYALSSQGTLVLIEEVDSQFRITGLGKNRAIPSVPCRHFQEYLMDSNGEILLVFLISNTSMNTIDDVEVFRLDLPRLVWEKKESLGDRALFMGTNCCISVTANRVGCKRNHVYFTHRSLHCWKEYDIANGGISPCYDRYGSQMKSPKWDQS